MMKKKVAKHTIAYFVIAALLLLIPMYVVSFAREKEEKTQVDILFLGDSLIGQYRDETSVPYLVGQALGKTAFNGAFGGSTMTWYTNDESDYYQRYGLNFPALVRAITTSDFSSQRALNVNESGTEDFESVIGDLQNIDYDKLDMILLEYGTNDYFAGTKVVGGEGDYFSFEASFREGIERLQECLPACRIIIVGPTFCWNYSTEMNCEEVSYGGAYLSDYVDMLETLSDVYQIEFIDLYDLYDHSFNIYQSNRYTEDGIHPNVYGRQLIVDEIVEYLEANP